jgi:hypothetical protein
MFRSLLWQSLFGLDRRLGFFAVGREIIERNPPAFVTRHRVGGPLVLMDRVLSEDELSPLARRLAQAGLSEASAAAVWILLATGARVGELTGTIGSEPKSNVAELTRIAGASGVKFGTVDLQAQSWHLPTTRNERDYRPRKCLCSKPLRSDPWCGLVARGLRQRLGPFRVPN